MCLEARRRVGGRVHSPLIGGQRVDLGGEVVELSLPFERHFVGRAQWPGGERRWAPRLGTGDVAAIASVVAEAARLARRLPAPTP